LNTKKLKEVIPKRDGEYRDSGHVEHWVKAADLRNNHDGKEIVSVHLLNRLEI
jgi:hypothetical protein